MKVKDGVTLAGLHLLMRPALKAAEIIWISHGIEEGVTVTETRGGVHSAGSWHPYGLAIDLRSRYFDAETKSKVYADLIAALPMYDVVNHSTHFHIEVSNSLADKHGLLI